MDERERTNPDTPAFRHLRKGKYRTMKLHSLGWRRGFTLVEMMMTLASSSIVMAAVIVGAVALQRSFAAVEGYSIAEGDQLRVSDYIAMDCRRALRASVDAFNTLTLTIPNYYDANNDKPKWVDAQAVAPSFTSTGAIQYGAGTTTVKYYASAANF